MLWSKAEEDARILTLSLKAGSLPLRGLSCTLCVRLGSKFLAAVLVALAALPLPPLMDRLCRWSGLSCTDCTDYLKGNEVLLGWNLK